MENLKQTTHLKQTPAFQRQPKIVEQSMKIRGYENEEWRRDTQLCQSRMSVRLGFPLKATLQK